MSFEGKKVLITGGLGFVGSNLAIRLTSMGATVTIVDSLIPEYGGNLRNIEEVRNQVTINISDVRDEHSMKYLIKDQDFLFNLAGQTSHVDSMVNPYPDLEINARAQLSILEACRKYNDKIKLVYASTRQIYGKPQYLPVDERHPLYPVDINGINKMAGEWYHLIYNNVYGIRSTVLRLTNTYGPRMRVKDARQTFLGIWIKNLIDEKPILVFGDGKQIRDFNYVDDVIDALIFCAESEDANGEIYNLGADDPISLKDAAELLVGINKSGTYKFVEFPSDRKVIDIGDYYSDYRKIKARLAWKPKILLEEGLRKTLEYYKINKNFYWGREND
ncbi:MAG: NAD-dependent epimerase/dehydratase family protein [Ignavibacteria bacterium]|jgi:UDP-glucose 4-epimerase|nr:NAD-dependent epimerase/dehydratase family protein [Ignavibacteria bacterium]